MIDSQGNLDVHPAEPTDTIGAWVELARKEKLCTEEQLTHAPMVMVVEDDASISRSLQIRLDMHGFRVCQAYDAVLAMDVAKKNRPDVVILDVSIPGGSGFDVAKRLREEPETANVPVIFLTASLRPDLPQRAAELGAAAFLTKPFDSSELMAEIRNLL